MMPVALMSSLRGYAQLRLRQFQWLDLRLLLHHRVDVRHGDHGILVGESQSFVLRGRLSPTEL